MLLDPNELDLFFRWHKAFMFLVNQRLKVIPRLFQPICEYCQQCRAARALQSGVSERQSVALSDADLQIVISNWHRLPAAIRNAIMGLARFEK